MLSIYNTLWPTSDKVHILFYQQRTKKKRELRRKYTCALIIYSLIIISKHCISIHFRSPLSLLKVLSNADRTLFANIFQNMTCWLISGTLKILQLNCSLCSELRHECDQIGVKTNSSPHKNNYYILKYTMMKIDIFFKRK